MIMKKCVPIKLIFAMISNNSIIEIQWMGQGGVKQNSTDIRAQHI